MIWQAVDDEALDSATQALIDMLKNASPDASVCIEYLDVAVDNTFEQQLALEMEHQAVLIPKNMRGRQGIP